MNKKSILKNIIYILGNLGLIIIISFATGEAQTAQRMFQLKKMHVYITIIRLMLCLFGILIEYKKVLKAFKKGFSIKKSTAIVGILMLVYACLPFGYVFSVTRFISLGVGRALEYPVVKYMFNIWSGILIARSMVVKQRV